MTADRVNGRRPTTAPETPLRVILVLEANLSVLGPDDAAQQVATLAKHVGRMRDRVPVIENLRIALDEPGAEPVASTVLRYLDDKGGRL